LKEKKEKESNERTTTGGATRFEREQLFRAPEPEE